MKQNPSEKVKQILDDLERELYEIKIAISNHCGANPPLNRLRVVFGLSRLDDLHFTPDEFKERITDLRANYISVNNKLSGFFDIECNL